MSLYVSLATAGERADIPTEHAHRAYNRRRCVSAERVRAEHHQAGSYAPAGIAEEGTEAGMDAAIVARGDGDVHVCRGLVASGL